MTIEIPDELVPAVAHALKSHALVILEAIQAKSNTISDPKKADEISQALFNLGLSLK